MYYALSYKIQQAFGYSFFWYGYNLVKALWTVLKRSGVNTFLICEALGRSSERVTQAVKMTIDKMFSDI